MQFRHRIQFQSWLGAVLLLAIGLFGWREPSRETTPNARATLCKAGAVFTSMPGRDARSIARKTPAPGAAQVDFPLENTFAFAGGEGTVLGAKTTPATVKIRPGETIRERAPPAAA